MYSVKTSSGNGNRRTPIAIEIFRIAFPVSIVFHLSSRSDDPSSIPNRAAASGDDSQ
jgi:hypothetical protein